MLAVAVAAGSIGSRRGGRGARCRLARAFLFARGHVGEDHEGDEEEDGADYGGGNDAALDHGEVWGGRWSSGWFVFV